MNFHDVQQGSFDFETKELTFAKDGLDTRSGEPTSLQRCEDGTSYDFLPGSSEEWREDTANVVPCEFSTSPSRQAVIGDRFSANGLTSDQAADYVDYLRDKDVFEVRALSLVEHRQKQYLKFEAELAPKEEPVGGLPAEVGLQYMLFAVRDGAGVDVAELPFGYIGDVSGGLRLTWYVDPATKLPAYGEFDSYEPGAAEEVANSYRYEVSYRFGKLEEIGRSKEPLSLDW